jgi:hypothetical protein
MVITGRSFFRFAERNGNPGRVFVACVFLLQLLSQDERDQAQKRTSEGRFRALHAQTDEALTFLPLEHLAQAPYPPVASLALDPASGGMVRSFGAGDLDADETRLIAWKSGVVTELIRTLLRRGLPAPREAAILSAPAAASREISSRPEIMAPFTSFNTREALDRA